MAEKEITYKVVKPHFMIQAPKATDALAFYKEAFAMEEIMKAFMLDKPLIMHAHIRIGET